MITWALEELMSEAFDVTDFDQQHPCQCQGDDVPAPSIFHKDTYFDSYNLASTVVCNECGMEMGSVRFAITLTQE